jgi:hypothetical protein
VRPDPEIGNAGLHTPMGGVLQETIFLKVRFQKAVGNSPSKCDFDFGSRCCRLSAIEASFFQKQLQHFFCIDGFYLPFSPVFSFGDLRIQFRPVLSEVHAFHITNLFVNIVAGGGTGIV